MPPPLDAGADVALNPGNGLPNGVAAAGGIDVPNGVGALFPGVVLPNGEAMPCGTLPNGEAAGAIPTPKAGVAVCADENGLFAVVVVFEGSVDPDPAFEKGDDVLATPKAEACFPFSRGDATLYFAASLLNSSFSRPCIQK